MSNNVRQARLRWTGEGLAFRGGPEGATDVSYTHLRAHETLRYLVCRGVV